MKRIVSNHYKILADVCHKIIFCDVSMLYHKHLLHPMKHRAIWTSDVDTTAAMMRNPAAIAPLKIISGLAPNNLSRTPVKIPGKATFKLKIGHTYIVQSLV